MDQEKAIVVPIISQLSQDGSCQEVIQAFQQESKNHDESTNTGTGGAVNSSDELISHQVTMTRKRGRPTEFDQLVEKPTLLASPPSGFTSPLSVTCQKRPRGRPRGSGRMQLLASHGGYLAETAGGCFTPHVLIVHPDEDIVKRVLGFSQKGNKAVCVVCGSGVVSSVVIGQPCSSGGILRYEGRFEILTLSGSFTLGDTAGKNRKTGMLSVSLAKPDGRVFGGGIVGPLIAAGPIQLIVGSFKQNISKELKQLRRTAELSQASAPVIGENSEIARINSTQNNDDNIGNDEQNNCTATSACAVTEIPINNEAVTVNEDQDAMMNSADDPHNNFELSEDQINAMTLTPI